jgi:hypothetical protein
MHVADDDHSGLLSITVASNTQGGSVYLFAHTRNLVKYAETAMLENGTAHFVIDRNKLGDGVSQLTIFNAERRPVCERLYFKRPASQLLVNAASDQLQYGTRKKIDIDIDTKAGDNRQTAANLSLAVYRIDTLQHISHDDIESYLWLASDLKGNIQSPEYYFKNNNAETEEAADNLMLTQGWRRFNWDDILNNKAAGFSFLPEYNGPIVTGKLTNKLTNAPETGIIAYLAIPGKRVQMYTSQSDSTGKLLFNMKDFYGPGEIVVQTNTEIDTVYHIDILNPFSEQYAKLTLPPAPQFTGLTRETAIANAGLGVQVQSIYLNDKLRRFYDPEIDSAAFYGPPSKTYLLDNYTRFTTIEEIMREYVSEVNISHTKTGFHILVLNPDIYAMHIDPLMLVDGVPFFSVNTIFKLDPLKFRKLEDVPYRYYWGPSEADGVFSFTSYKGDMGGAEIDPRAVIMDYDGLEEQRIFYSPEYDTETSRNSRIPDYRDVLYWAPDINTNAQGKSNLSFYTSDKTGKYIGVIQGMTASGEAGSQSFTFQVVK